MKFRAYINKTTIIFFDFESLLNGLFSSRELLIPWLKAGNKPDRFAGLKDKSGKDIYERYIIKYTTLKGDFIDTVKFYNGAFGVNDMSFDYMEEELNMEQIEIIGNIDENPELLEAKND